MHVLLDKIFQSINSIVGRILEKIGQKGRGTCELFFDGMRISVCNVLGGVAAIERALQLTLARAQGIR